jgi:hypothetical protein
LTRVRAPASDSEAGLFEAVSPESQRIGVAIVAATDDESPQPVTSYLLPLDGASAGLATSQRDPLGQIDRAAYPRLVEWANGIIGSPFYDCSGDSQPPFWLFPPLCRNHWGGRHCPGYSVAESAPGVGRCSIQITTLEPVECEASRGWIDPLDDEGARRPRMTDTGGRVCDMMLVDPSVMDACIHDETCPDCGSGWCVSDVLPLAKYCPAGTSPLPLRWVGGALPSPGLVHISCLKRAEPAGP